MQRSTERIRRLKKLKSVTATQDGGGGGGGGDGAATAENRTSESSDTNGGAASGSGGKEPGSLNLDIFKHFDKSGRSELYVCGSTLRHRYKRSQSYTYMQTRTHTRSTVAAISLCPAAGYSRALLCRLFGPTVCSSISSS